MHVPGTGKPEKNSHLSPTSFPEKKAFLFFNLLRAQLKAKSILSCSLTTQFLFPNSLMFNLRATRFS